MATQDFLSLVNTVLRRFNEVELVQANFLAARGFHAQVKDAINLAIRDINSSGVEWPFNIATADLTLVPGQQAYPYITGTRVVDAESFRLLRNDALGIGNTRDLSPVSYDDWRNRYIREDGDATQVGVPSRAILAHARNIVVSPAPDKAYTLRYDYFAQPDDLIYFADVTNVPTAYLYVIHDCAAMHCHIFRTDMEAANALQKLYQQGLKDMRKNLINRNEYVRPTLSGV